jgi:hypothetical protein
LGDTKSRPLRTALSILADLVQIVNARERGVTRRRGGASLKEKSMNHEGHKGLCCQAYPGASHVRWEFTSRTESGESRALRGLLGRFGRETGRGQSHRG